VEIEGNALGDKVRLTRISISNNQQFIDRTLVRCAPLPALDMRRLTWEPALARSSANCMGRECRSSYG
jgi:hypothetical protein